MTKRARLLGYYWGRQFRDPGARAARVPQIIWLIDHHPGLAVLGSPYAAVNRATETLDWAKADSAWQAQLRRHPHDASVLGNVAAHDKNSGEYGRAEMIYRDAETQQPTDERWPESLGQLYLLEGIPSRSSSSDLSARALIEFERSYRLSSGPTKVGKLPTLAKTAFLADDMTKARRYAQLALASSPENWNRGNAIHDGHMVLGRVLLRSGDVRGAERELKAAGTTPGSPQLNSFGPNMSLANDLLVRGSKDAVLVYFDECAVFWKDRRLAQWRADVVAGRTPTFGGNLVY
ncbi:MAG: tetratricopeptide repeat protein [Candidatus Dormibacteria bacterium]